MLVSASAHPLHLSGLQAGDRLDANSYLALDSAGRIILTASVTTTQATQIQNAASSEDSGIIGDPEDGSYADGLFTDFATSTPVGTAVDRFNEVLKILAPSPAPAVKTIKADEANGAEAKLSFASGDGISGYQNAAILQYSKTPSGLDTIFPAIGQNDIYQVTSSVITDAANSWQNATHFQLGVYNNQEITGTINYNVGASITNGYLAYASGGFGSAETGSLQLYRSGWGSFGDNSIVHSVDLSAFTGSGIPGTGSASSLNSSGSGFIFLSTTASSYDGNNSEWHIFKHRTARFKLSAADQASGSNLVQVRHVVDGTTYYSNWIQWVNDP